MDGLAKIRSYRDLIAWQKAMDLVEHIYVGTRNWPKAELYGLTNQVQRAAVSVPSNIAEGQGRTSTKEFLHHLSIARGSLFEVETQLLIAQRLNYLTKTDADRLLSEAGEISRLLSGLLRSLNNANH
ncbi:MAG TPA: four helix bundle protein [Chloroflexia bacterium]|jgi:four helix bundle protein